MNPQTIVYIGLFVVAIGITVSAIDPLKPEPTKMEMIWAELEIENPQDYYIDCRRTSEINDFTYTECVHHLILGQV